MVRALSGMVLALSVLALGAGCASYTPAAAEPLRVGNVRDLDAAALGLRPGETTLAQARAALVREQATGIVEDTYAAEGGPVLEVLGADYQGRVHVFEGGKYVESLALPTHGLPPYGLALRLGSRGRAPLLLVLYRDPLARTEEPPTLLAFQGAATPSSGSGPRFVYAGRASFEALVAKHDGMTRPMLLGNDLATGVMLVARDRAGDLWDESYLLRVERGQLELEARPMSEAMRCSCVRAYASGAARSN